MSKTLPQNANLAWLKKTAKQQLRVWRAEGRSAKLADVQLMLARDYGFSSWRALRAALPVPDKEGTAAPEAPSDERAEQLLRSVGQGRLSDVRDLLEATPGLVNRSDHILSGAAGHRRSM